MTDAQRAVLDFASRSLDYPDEEFFAALPSLRRQAEDMLDAQAAKLFAEFIAGLERDGAIIAQQKYVAVFDHNPATSLYLAWHRYGNDRGQGKALAALNGLYRAAGLEPIWGSMPDYLPRMLEFMALSEDWAVETMLDGFGPEIAILIDNLLKADSERGSLLQLAFAPLKTKWPQLFKPRNGQDSTRRPMARPEPEKPLRPLEILTRANMAEEDDI